MPVPHSSPWLRFQSPRVEQTSSTGSFTATAGVAARRTGLVDRIVHRYRRLGAVAARSRRRRRLLDRPRHPRYPDSCLVDDVRGPTPGRPPHITPAPAGNRRGPHPTCASRLGIRPGDQSRSGSGRPHAATDHRRRRRRWRTPHRLARRFQPHHRISSGEPGSRAGRHLSLRDLRGDRRVRAADTVTGGQRRGWQNRGNQCFA